jgi:hypothetical protein
MAYVLLIGAPFRVTNGTVLTRSGRRSRLSFMRVCAARPPQLLLCSTLVLDAAQPWEENASLLQKRISSLALSGATERNRNVPHVRSVFVNRVLTPVAGSDRAVCVAATTNPTCPLVRALAGPSQR